MITLCIRPYHSQASKVYLERFLYRYRYHPLATKSNYLQLAMLIYMYCLNHYLSTQHIHLANLALYEF